MKHDKPVLIDTKTAALAANVTTRTIQLWIKRNRLKNHGTPRHIRVSMDELARCLATTNHFA